MKRILILGGSMFQVPVVKQAKEMGLYVGLVDISEKAPAIKYADEYFQCSVKDEKSVLRIAKEFNANAVCVGICDSAMNTAAFVCKELKLPGTSPEVARCATDKYEMIKAFEKNNVAHPAFQLVKQDELEKFVPSIPYPLISKPVDSAGSKGICLIKDKDMLYDSLKASSSFSSNGNVLVEEMMEGKEISVELIVIKGVPYVVQTTDKFTTGAPHFIEIGHVQPSRQSDEEISAAKELVVNAAKAVGLYNSAGHAEVYLTKDGPKMVEIAGRMGGDGIAEQLVSLSTGINMCKISIEFALGTFDGSLQNKINASSSSMFILPHKGEITSIDGVEKAEAVKGVQEISLFSHIGECINEATDNAGRIGYIISTGSTQAEAISICKKALDEIKIEYR